jgi:pyruvate dehydrogenase E2 component (dihydrolipoamide acetyltransferase)
MAIKVLMEALSPTMEEGRLVEWKKAEGDEVKAGDVLAEVETDKAVMELVARAGGTLLKQVVAAGATVPVTSVVGWIGTPGEAVGGEAEGRKGGEAGGGKREATPAQATESPRSAPLSPGPSGRVKASPLARKLATEKGLDLGAVAGSGPEGRIVKRDLEAAASRMSDRPTIPPSDRPPLRPPTGTTGFTDTPLSQLRKTIARRLAQSIGPVPTFYLTTEVDMERAAEAREGLKTALGDEGKVSFNDIILKAIATALRQHPECNAWWQDDRIRSWHEVHIGMAVAIPDGLITPVIRDADRKSLREISAEARDLAQRARDRKLQPEEYTGSTFSVSNLGMFDIDEFTAIINPPEAGIIAIGRIAEAPAVVDGQVQVRRRMRLTMSCDHRVIDGATGAQFLRTVKLMLENPLALVW